MTNPAHHPQQQEQKPAKASCKAMVGEQGEPLLHDKTRENEGANTMTTTVENPSLAVPHPMPEMRRRDARFELGALVATPAALEMLEIDGEVGLIAALRLVRRHVTGDFGQLEEDDREANETAIAHGYRVMSVYDLPCGTVWVITEHDRSATTVLLPSDY